MLNYEFDVVEEHLTYGSPKNTMLFCRTHEVMIGVIPFPQDADGLLALQAAILVAREHMKSRGCKVLFIEPFIPQ